MCFCRIKTKELRLNIGVYDVQVQLIRIELRVPEYGWTTQKVFHLMNFIVNGGDFGVGFLSFRCHIIL